MNCGHGPLDPAAQVLNQYIEREFEAFALRADRVVKDRHVLYMAAPSLQAAVLLANGHQVVNAETVVRLLDKAEAGKNVAILQRMDGSLSLLELK